MEVHVILQTVWPDKKGLTLVEVMIALLILLVVSLALMQTAMVSIDANTRNASRDEAVKIAEELMDEARNLPFDDFDQNGTADPDPLTMNGTVNRQIKNTTITYTTTTVVDTFNQDNKEIDITVSWTWAGQLSNHRISTIRKR
jgi:prepilin-type N-terminal cleavage/methylation domain-containing protein